jgi:hypothetical protein
VALTTINPRRSLRIGMDQMGVPLTDVCSPDAKKAVKRGVTAIMATPLSTPASCKTNKNLDDGGLLISDDGGSRYDGWSGDRQFKGLSLCVKRRSSPVCKRPRRSPGADPRASRANLRGPCPVRMPSQLHRTPPPRLGFQHSAF